MAMRLMPTHLTLLVYFISCVLHPSKGTEDTSCSQDAFQCKQEFSHKLFCMPRNWLCDGEDDCPDGDDENDCDYPITCSPSQFQCSSGIMHCISRGWQCDGENDCDNGTDEDPSLCYKHKTKGVFPRGDILDEFRCLPNQYQCPGTHDCIHYSKLCDGNVDCPLDVADEGGHCRNEACGHFRCSEVCMETIQGARCYCGDTRVPQGDKCVDLDECQYDEFCDQICVNSQNGYRCMCHHGYIQNNSRCVLDPAGDVPYLIQANQTSVHMVKMDGSSLDSPWIVNLQGMLYLTLALDVANNSLCWVTHGSTLMCNSRDNVYKTWNITTQFSLDYVKHIAKDWISGNWYFADDVKEMIFLCTKYGHHCHSIITLDISRPKSLALDPTQGYLFYADWSLSSKIVRVDLDGNNRLDLVTKKIVHPHGITLDFTKRQLYWGDSFLDFIGRIDYTGKNHRIIAHGLNVLDVFSIALLENSLYIISNANHTVLRLHRYSTSFPTQILNSSLIKPSHISIWHSVRQPTNESLKKMCQLKNCSHFCIPVPGNDSAIAKCMCRHGYRLVQDTQCQRLNVTAYLLYANAQQGIVRSVAMDPSIKEDVQSPISNLMRPVALAVDPRNNDIYYSDVSSLHIGRRDGNSENTSIILLGKGSGLTSCEGLAIDYVGNNLYWTDDDHRSIFAASLNNFSVIVTLVDSNLTHPKSIALDPLNGMMYWTDWVVQPSYQPAKIESALMDGSQRRTLVDEEIQWPNSLCLDLVERRLYWTEAYYDRIQSIDLNGSNKRTVQQLHQLQHPYGIAYYAKKLYFTESLQGLVLSYDPDSNITVILRNDSKPIFDLVSVVPFEGEPNTLHPCHPSQRKCTDLCIPTGKMTAVCKCALGRQLKDDNATCTGPFEAVECKSDKLFKCSNGSCIPSHYKCDNIPHCEDHSDEAECGNVTCNGMFDCGNGQCIYHQFICDGEYDCLDKKDEDEINCKEHFCPSSNHTKCNNSSRCIPNVWLCDGEQDCPDGSDENESCVSECQLDQFRCHSGRCIPHTYRCDHEFDCADHSDEIDCNAWCDPVMEFKCKNSTVCLPLELLCDGQQNCPDGYDELRCFTVPSHACHNSEFTCVSDSSCVPRLSVCDGIDDCVDKSDENNCNKNQSVPANSTRQCHWSEFRCVDGSRCIPTAWKCDGDSDCTDRSDEKDCSFTSPCQLPKFSCNNSNLCLPPEKMCDGVWDCSDYSDEGRLCDYNMCLNHDCTDVCYNSPNGFVCGCHQHRRLHPDNKSCIDISVCDTWGACSQKCRVVPEGRSCYCDDGYRLMLDNYTCKAVGDNVPYVIFSNRHEIRQLNIVDKITMVSLVSGLRNTIALDFLWDKKWLFWTDVGDDKIYRGTILSNAVTDIQRIVDVGLATTEGVAVDWVAGNIYWVESNLDQIEVAKWDGSNRTTLLAGSMSSPRAIALDPRFGLLFWTDWDGEFPRIERCAMSGELETRMVVYDIRKVPGGGWPNGIALDYEAERLYWADARSDSVHSAQYDGSSHIVITISHEHLSHPFSLTVFEHHIYWTDWRLNSLVRANKFNGSDVEVIQRTYTQPFDLKIFHPLRQPPVKKNPCDKNGGCSHLCLLSLNNTFKCRCPHRFKLSKDNKTCIEDNTFLLYVKENEIRGVDLDNAHYNVIPSITVPFVENASAIDYYSMTDRLYWADSKRHVISSAFLNGTGIQTIIDTGLSNPEGFAIDWLSGNMYFSSYDEHRASFSVAKLDGAFRTELFYRNNSKPNSIVIHPKKGLMFWSDWAGETHSIMRAEMDGSNLMSFASDLHLPASLTLDLQKERLYWINRNQQQVYFCELNMNTSCKPSPDRQLAIPPAPFSMAIYDTFVYFSNTTNIIKVNRNSKKSQVMRNDVPRVSAMQVYAPTSRLIGPNGCSEKNGGCQQLCLPVSTGSKSGSNRICRCTSGFSLNKDNKTCYGVKSFLLYSMESEIHGISLDPAFPQETLAPLSKISLAASVDFYAAEDLIFWVDTASHTISRVKRDLSERQTIVKEGISRIETIAVDWIGENIYWIDQGLDIVQISKLNGSNRYVVIHDDMEKPRSLAVDPLAGYLYYSDWGSYPRIVRAYLDGSQRENLIVSDEKLDVKAPYGISVDHTENMLYWCDKSLDKIERVNLTDRTRHVIVDTNLTDCVSVAVHDNHVYWADLTDLNGSIKRANKDGSNIVVLKTNITKLSDIKIFEEKHQTGTSLCSENNGGCQELCLFRGDGKVTCACSHGKLAQDKKSCEEHDSFLLFSKVTSIESILPSNHTNLNPPKPTLEDARYMQNVIGLAFDYDTQRVFFSDIQSGDIWSVLFNNSDYKKIVHGVGSVEGLSYDSMHHALYWTSYTNSSINMMSFSPQSTTDINLKAIILIQLSTADHPRAIVINPCMKRLFWTNWNDNQPCIQTALYNGYKAESIITDNIRTPNGLAIDLRAEKLYWSDARLDKIERCDYDGSNRVAVVMSNPQHIFSIAVHGDYLYWTDWMLRAVLRANKYDGSEVVYLRKDIQRQPMGIIAVDRNASFCELSPCHKNAFGCSEICSVTADSSAVCSCIKGHRLMPDDKQCVDEAAYDSCQKDSFVCESKMQCVPFNLTCNGKPDCKDSSDESLAYCSTRKCPASYFDCFESDMIDMVTHLCIRMDQVCDGHQDCSDNSDEENCPCGQDEFRCDDGMCIKKVYRCDNDSDCRNHSDEKGCNYTCNEKVGHVSCNTTSICIYPSWICDGTNDCLDNNDERNCNYPAEDCPKDAFTCDGGCILSQWRCDKDKDCADGSDELNCTGGCKADEIACNDTVCIPATWFCDGHPDCSDHSDENHTCVGRKCNELTEFQCPEGRCIPKEWTCDGDTDCNDGADESVDKASCDPIKCEPDQFQCLNQRCIRDVFYCDGDVDCEDKSDEPSTCVFEHCTAEEFKCKRHHKCIPIAKRCNNFFDCTDLSDEEDCSTPVPCNNSTYFQCHNEMCIEESKVCDGHNDCGDYSDEPAVCGVNECLNWNGGCSQLCRDKKIGIECYCLQGYRLKNNLRTCIDIDECKTEYPCSQICENTNGGYICRCTEHYVLERDRKSCKSPKGPKAQLLLANRYFIRLINTSSGSSSIMTSNLTNAVAVDYDWQDQFIYWSDITSFNSSINRMPFRNNQTAERAMPEVLHSTTVRNPDGLAVDWIGRNLYWCDKTTDTIEVSRLDGKYRLVLVREGLQEPRGLEVYPQRGLLFYTDWGDMPHIGRLNMDGTHKTIIIQENLAWPNALTIDYVTGTIFWADGNLDYIGMADWEGNNRRVVINQNRIVPHIFSITTFENRLYWTDWEKHAVQYADKFTGNNIRNLTTLVHRPMDLQVVHPLRQMTVVNALGHHPCHFTNCSHLCLLRPIIIDDQEFVEGVCACPENHYLAHDRRTCISNCTSSQILCEQSSKCIPFWWKCDHHKDCEDGSDEPPTCSPYHCPQPGMFQCNNSNSSSGCLFPYQICDGEPQCSDLSDEHNCQIYQCMEHYMKCEAEHKCIPEVQRCDRHNHCKDGQDERDCSNTTCSADQFQCKNLRCVPYVWRCDNDNDCGDNSDEPDDCRNTTCKSGHFQCSTTGRCIPDAWKCDGDSDCGDQDDSDEKSDECDQKTCDPTYFKCNNGHCIPGRWHCDYYDDCKDGTDERNCMKKNCTEDEFSCDNGKCISAKQLCDEKQNCEDGSDEISSRCDKSCSDKNEFQCKNIRHCIPSTWQCDGDADCSDGSDEWDCDRNCSVGEFKCTNSICKPILWVCDGDQDCGDGSDEIPRMCELRACAPGQFRCKNHTCIMHSMVCNGVRDCPDGEDESDINQCPHSNCDYPSFRCRYSTLCVPAHKVCDNVTDCAKFNPKDNSDEDHNNCILLPGFGNCTDRNGGCQQVCHQLEHSVSCSCKSGYKLNDDRATCTEINRCDVWGTCSQECEYDKSTDHIRCTCHEGYTSWNHYCTVAAKDSPSILFAVEKNIWTIVLSENSSTYQIPKEAEVLDNSHILAMDIDMTNISSGHLSLFAVGHTHNLTTDHWYINRHTLSVASFGSVESRIRKRQVISNTELVLLGTNEIRTLAIDWIAQHLYWIDATQRAILVAEYNASRKKIVISKLHNPQGLVVDAVNSQLYWTDRSSMSRIYRANLDGSEQMVVTDIALHWPNDLVLDSPNNRLYWVDSKKNTLETVTTHGQGREVVHTFSSTSSPIAVDVFAENLYVLTHNSTLFELHKFPSPMLPRKLHARIGEQIHDVLIFQPLKQKSVKSNCSASPCASTQICFNAGEQGYTCVCPDGSVLRDKRCDFIKPCPESYNCTNGGICLESNGASKCSCPPGYFGQRCELNVCTDVCQNGGTCVILPSGKPNCTCPPGFPADNWCVGCPPDFCHNGGQCVVEHFGYHRCKCVGGFKGDRCQHCSDKLCYNQGTCQIDKNGRQSCKCLNSSFDPATDCEQYSCTAVCNTAPHLWRKDCMCDCPPTYIKEDCGENPCNGHCLNHATCKLNFTTRQPICECPGFFEGPRCENCVCEPFGSCNINEDNVTVDCQCKDDYSGKFCETHLSSKAASQSGSPMEGLLIGIPVLVLVILIIIIVAYLIYRRKRRESQYDHKRMHEGGELNVTNPVYMRRDPEDEDDEEDEQAPLGASLIYTGNATTNFANPMYDVYNLPVESTQRLLSDLEIGCNSTSEERELLDNGLGVRYFGSNEEFTRTKKNAAA